MKAPIRLRHIILAASLCGLGCGSSDSEPASTPMTVDQWCLQAPAQICAARKSCCESGALGFDQAQCETNVKAECTSNAALVQAGTRGFDSSKAQACVDATKTAAAKCLLTSADYALRLSLKQSCKAAFPGALAVGATCTESAACKAGEGEAGVCDTSSHTCSVRPLTKDGDPCLSPNAACDTGLYCDTWTSPPAQTCHTLVSIGGPCPQGGECAPTGFCDMSSKLCTQPLEAYKPCTQNQQCDSSWCAINNQCAAVSAYLTNSECGVK